MQGNILHFKIIIYKKKLFLFQSTHYFYCYLKQRIAELEDFIRRKNATISKLKKDMLVLEQKVRCSYIVKGFDKRLGRSSSVF